MRTNLNTVFILIMLTTGSFLARAQNPGAKPPATAAVRPAAPQPTSAQSEDPNSPQAQNEPVPGYLTPFDYDPRGRRDPFQPPLDEKPVEQGSSHGPFLPLQKYDLAQMKLSAIIWDVSHPKAMITDPDGKVYIVGPNTKIGKNNGYIAVIREGEMVVVETTEDNGRLMSATRIVRLVSK